MKSEKEVFIEHTFSESSPSAAPQPEVAIPSEVVFLVPLLFLVIFSVAFLKQSNFSRTLYQRIITLKLYSQIPCFKCQFFKRSQYLPCAVQPCLVLTKEAVRCPDYLRLGTK